MQDEVMFLSEDELERRGKRTISGETSPGVTTYLTIRPDWTIELRTTSGRRARSGSLSVTHPDWEIAFHIEHVRIIGGLVRLGRGFYALGCCERFEEEDQYGGVWIEISRSRYKDARRRIAEIRDKREIDLAEYERGLAKSEAMRRELMEDEKRRKMGLEPLTKKQRRERQQRIESGEIRDEDDDD